MLHNVNIKSKFTSNENQKNVKTHISSTTHVLSYNDIKKLSLFCFNMMRYQQLDTAVESLNRKFPKMESEVEITRPKQESECKDCPAMNKYNVGQMIKKEEQKRIPKDAKDLKNFDFKPSIHRLPIDVKKIMKTIKPENKLEVEQDIGTGHRDIEVLRKIQQIRELIEMTKQQEPQTAKEAELLKKSEMAKKKYLNTLSNMQQKLKDIEYKYFTLPSIISKTIKTYHKPSNDISIGVNESKTCKKRVIIDENIPRSTLDKKDENVPSKSKISKPEPIKPEIQTAKPYKYSKDVKLLLNPNTMVPKKNPETKSDRSYLFKKNLEIFLEPKPKPTTEIKDNKSTKSGKHIEMLFTKGSTENDLVPNKNPRGNVGIPPKKNYTPPPFIQKIRHPELFPKQSVPINKPNTTVSPPESIENEEFISGQQVGPPFRKRISFNVSPSVKKSESFKKNEAKKLTAPAKNILKNVQDVGQAADTRKQRYSEQLWLRKPSDTRSNPK